MTKKFRSDAHRSQVWSNRRKLGGYMVALGAISDEQIAAFIATVESVSRIAADPEQIGLGTPCTPASEAMDMRGMLTQQGEG